MHVQIVLVRIEYRWNIYRVPAITRETEPDALHALLAVRGREDEFSVIDFQPLGDLEDWTCPDELRDQTERAWREFRNGLPLGLGLPSAPSEMPQVVARSHEPETRWLERHRSDPVDLSDDVPRTDNLPEAISNLLKADEGQQLFAILDGAEIHCLFELLEMSSVPHLSLHTSDTADIVGDNGLVLADLSRGATFTRNLFLDAEPGWALGALHSGLFIKARASLQDLQRHLVRFVQVRDAQGKSFFHRLGGHQAAWLFLEYLSLSKTDAATFFFPPARVDIAQGLAWHRDRKTFVAYSPTPALSANDRAPEFIVSQPYLDFLHRERSKIRAVDLIPKLRQSFPGPIKDVDDKTLFDRIFFASLGARDIGIRDAGNITKFIFVSVYYRPFFWTDPDTRNRLTNVRDTPDSLFADYYAMLKLYLRRQIGEDVLP